MPQKKWRRTAGVDRQQAKMTHNPGGADGKLAVERRDKYVEKARTRGERIWKRILKESAIWSRFVPVWSGVERSGVIWSGLDRSGVFWPPAVF